MKHGWVKSNLPDQASPTQSEQKRHSSANHILQMLSVLLCRCKMDVRMLVKVAVVVVAVLPLAASTCNYSPQVCSMLYQQMETALLKDSENLYRLRQAFFPNAQPEPTVLRVTFGLRLRNVSSKPCDGAMNSNLDSLQLSKQFFWTSSAVFSALNPRILDLFLP